MFLQIIRCLFGPSAAVALMDMISSWDVYKIYTHRAHKPSPSSLARRHPATPRILYFACLPSYGFGSEKAETIFRHHATCSHSFNSTWARCFPVVFASGVALRCASLFDLAACPGLLIYWYTFYRLTVARILRSLFWMAAICFCASCCFWFVGSFCSFFWSVCSSFPGASHSLRGRGRFRPICCSSLCF